MKRSRLYTSLLVICLHIPVWECTLVREEDICEQPRTKLFMDFVSRMENALANNEDAQLALEIQPFTVSDSMDNTICKADKKPFFGFWTNNGEDLCLVVQPERQRIWKAKCSGKACCGSSTRCVPQNRKLAPLLFCSRLIWVPGDGDPDLEPGISILEISNPDIRQKRDLGDEEDTNGYVNGTRTKRSSANNGFVVIIDLEIPVSCTCVSCTCKKNSCT